MWLIQAFLCGERIFRDFTMCYLFTNSIIPQDLVTAVCKDHLQTKGTHYMFFLYIYKRNMLQSRDYI